MYSKQRIKLCCTTDQPQRTSGAAEIQNTSSRKECDGQPASITDKTRLKYPCSSRSGQSTPLSSVLQNTSRAENGVLAVEQGRAQSRGAAPADRRRRAEVQHQQTGGAKRGGHRRRADGRPQQAAGNEAQTGSNDGVHDGRTGEQPRQRLAKRIRDGRRSGMAQRGACRSATGRGQQGTATGCEQADPRRRTGGRDGRQMGAADGGGRPRWAAAGSSGRWPARKKKSPIEPALILCYNTFRKNEQ